MKPKFPDFLKYLNSTMKYNKVCSFLIQRFNLYLEQKQIANKKILIWYKNCKFNWGNPCALIKRSEVVSTRLSGGEKTTKERTRPPIKDAQVRNMMEDWKSSGHFLSSNSTYMKLSSISARSIALWCFCCVVSHFKIQFHFTVYIVTRLQQIEEKINQINMSLGFSWLALAD